MAKRIHDGGSFYEYFRPQPGKTYTLRELFFRGEATQQSARKVNQMNSNERINGLGGLEEVNHDALLGRKPKTDLSWLNVGKKNFVLGALFVGVIVIMMAAYFHWPVKIHDKNMERAWEQDHHQVAK